MAALGNSSRLEYIAGARRHSALSREVASLIGRILLSRRPPRKNGYLHLGSGTLFEEGYCNADFFPFNGLRRLLGRPAKPVDWGLDIRYPLKCRDAFFKGVFCEHTLEHIDVWAGIQLMGELHRVLQPGAVLRITVPSLEKYIAYYTGEAPHPNFETWSVKSEAIWNLTHNWGHQAVYDFELLGQLLEQAGFTDITQCEYRQGRDEALLLDHKSRRWETLYVEAVRP